MLYRPDKGTADRSPQSDTEKKGEFKNPLEN